MGRSDLSWAWGGIISDFESKFCWSFHLGCALVPGLAGALVTLPDMVSLLPDYLVPFDSFAATVYSDATLLILGLLRFLFIQCDLQSLSDFGYPN